MKTKIIINVPQKVKLLQLNEFRNPDSDTVFAKVYNNDSPILTKNGECEIVVIKFGRVMGINSNRWWDSTDQASNSFHIEIIDEVVIMGG